MYDAVITSTYTPASSSAFVRRYVTSPRSPSATKPSTVPVKAGSSAPATFEASAAVMVTAAGTTVKLPGTTSAVG